jgi:hypothetical protein
MFLGAHRCRLTSGQRSALFKARNPAAKFELPRSLVEPVGRDAFKAV